MPNSTSSRRATYLLLVGVALAALGPGASTAIATVDVFHSSADDGVNPGGSVGLTEESSATDVYLYVENPGPSSTTGTVCENGDGHEICGYDVAIEAVAGIQILSFDASPGSEITFSHSSSRIRLNGLTSVDGQLGPIRIGRLVVSTGTLAEGGMLVLRHGQAVDAGLDIVDAPEQSIAHVPEPGLAAGIIAGILGLAALSRRRRRPLSTVLVLSLIVIGVGRTATADTNLDWDGDDEFNFVDNCPYRTNSTQADPDGVDRSGPDGVGSVCQCGDVDDDGAVDLRDLVIMRRAFDGGGALGPGVADPSKCSITGGADDCDQTDLAHLKDVLAEKPATVANVCRAFVGTVQTPADLKAVPGDARVLLDWERVPSDLVTEYRVYRSTSPTVPLGSVYATVGPDQSSFADVVVSNGTSYYYVVTAMGAVETAASNEVVAVPQAPNASCAAAADITADTTWALVNSPCTVSTAVTVRSGATLTIEPGVTVLFDPGAGLTIGAPFDPGAIRALGSEVGPVSFLGSTGSAGEWRGIDIQPTALDGLVLDHVVIEDAGHGNRPSLELFEPRRSWQLTDGTIAAATGDAIRFTDGEPILNGWNLAAPPAAVPHSNRSFFNLDYNPTSASSTRYAVVAFGSPQLTLANSTLFGGILMSDDGSESTFKGLVHNAYDTGSPLTLSPNLVGPVMAASTINGATSGSLVWVVQGAFVDSAAWPKFRYRVSTYFVIAGNNAPVLTLEAGATLLFDKNLTVEVGSNDLTKPGGLIAHGLPDDEILFTSWELNPAQNPWKRLWIRESALDSTLIDHVRFEWGGGDTPASGVIHLTGASEAIRLLNGTIVNSPNRGFVIQGGAPEIRGWAVTSSGAAIFAVGETAARFSDIDLTSFVDIRADSPNATFSNLAFTGAQFHSLHSSMAGAVLEASTFDSPFEVHLYGGEISRTSMWPPGTYHAVSGSLFVRGVDNPVLYLQAGATLKLTVGARRLFVGDSDVAKGGGLLMLGEAEMPVRVEGGGGIVFQQSALPESTLAYVIFSDIDHCAYAVSCETILFDSAPGPITVTDSQFLRSQGDEIRIESSSPTITRNLFTDSWRDGIECDGASARPLIADNIIRARTGALPSQAGVRSSCNPTILRNSIERFGIGLSIAANGEPALFRNNNFVDITTTKLQSLPGAKRVDARLNWWGDPAEPSPPTGGGAGALLNPWLGVAFDPAGVEIETGSITPEAFPPVDSETVLAATFESAGDWTIDVSGPGGARSFSGSGASVAQVWVGDDNSSQTLPSGTYDFDLTVQPPGGGALQRALGRIRLDSSLPVAKLSAPAQLSVHVERGSTPLGGGVPPLIDIVGEASGPPATTYRVQYAFGHAPADSAYLDLTSTAAAPFSGVLHSWDTTGLTSGVYTIRLVAESGASRAEDLTTVRLLSATAPVASTGVISPNDDDRSDHTGISAQTSIDVDWTLAVRDATNAIIYEETGSGTAPGFVWKGETTTPPLLEGTYSLRLTAIEPASGVAVEATGGSIDVDLTGPVVGIDSPAQGAALTDYTAVDVVGTANDPHPGTYQLSWGSGAQPASFTAIGSPANMNKVGQLLGQLPADNGSSPLYTGEALTLRVAAEDAVGNRSSTTRVVTLDRLAISNIEVAPQVLEPGVDQSAISYDLGGDANVTVAIYPSGGGPLVATLLDAVAQPAGHHLVGWDGRDDLLQPVADGEYFVSIQASDGQGRTVEVNPPGAPAMGDLPFWQFPASFNGTMDNLDSLASSAPIDPLKNETLRIQYTMDRPGHHQVELRKPPNCLLVDPACYLLLDEVIPGGTTTVYWDGRSSDDEILLNHAYKIYLSAPTPIERDVILVRRPRPEPGEWTLNPYVFRPMYSQPATVFLTTPHQARVRIDIYDPQDSYLFTLFDNVTDPMAPAIEPGPHFFEWDGRIPVDQSPDPDYVVVGDEGIYRVRIDLTDELTGVSKTRDLALQVVYEQ